MILDPWPVTLDPLPMNLDLRFRLANRFHLFNNRCHVLTRRTNKTASNFLLYLTPFLSSCLLNKINCYLTYFAMFSTDECKSRTSIWLMRSISLNALSNSSVFSAASALALTSASWAFSRALSVLLTWANAGPIILATGSRFSEANKKCIQFQYTWFQ